MSSDDYARAIIAEGQRRRVTQRGIVIALATALVESAMKMWANAKVPESLSLPHDAVGSDGYSVGLFQQQVIRGGTGQWWWADCATCMDPTKSAGLFYDRLARLDYNNPAIASATEYLGMKAVGSCKQGACRITPWSSPKAQAKMTADKIKITWKY